MIWIAIPEIVFRTSFLLLRKTMRYIAFRRFFNFCIPPLAYGTWMIMFIVATTKGFNNACYEPYPSYSLVITVINVLVMLEQAAYAICAVSVLTLFCPCLTYIICKAIGKHRDKVSKKDKAAKALG
jgi:CDP-diglyceride synthetase